MILKIRKKEHPCNQPYYKVDYKRLTKDSIIKNIKEQEIYSQLQYLEYSMLIKNHQYVFELFYEFDVVDILEKYYYMDQVVRDKVNKTNRYLDDFTVEQNIKNYAKCRKTMRCILILKKDLNDTIIDNFGNSLQKKYYLIYNTNVKKYTQEEVKNLFLEFKQDFIEGINLNIVEQEIEQEKGN